MRVLKAFTLTHQFRLLSFLILLGEAVIVALWIGRQIETGVLNRTAKMTSMYVESFFSPDLHVLSSDGHLGPDELLALDRLLTETSLKHEVVAFKLWGPGGRVLYSLDSGLVGQHFALNDELGRAFAGKSFARIDEPGAMENAREGKLIKIYVPVRSRNEGEVIAVVEFHQAPGELQTEIQTAQRRSWVLVGVTTLALYLLLTRLVSRADDTLQTQRVSLVESASRLKELATRNEQLYTRVHQAVDQTTALNERFLHRISADLHDGPAQDLALALLRVDSLGKCQHCLTEASPDVGTIKTALNSALGELRAISSGLRLPEIDELSPAETAYLAVRDYERKTHCPVALTLGDLPDNLSLPTKATLYRVLQEALNNGYHHAGGVSQAVRLEKEVDQLRLEVTDAGGGFDPGAVPRNGHLGLAGMCERLELLGGRLEVESLPEYGTTVRAYLPLASVEVNDV